jgi:hypothetical protein
MAALMCIALAGCQRDTAIPRRFPCRGRTITRLKSGSILHNFPSALPNGSNKTRRAAHVFCILDTVYHEPDDTYYITDVLAWNGVHLCNSSLECRHAWTRCQFLHSPASQVCLLESKDLVYQSFGGCVPDCACWSCILESKDVIIGYIRALFGVFQTVVVGTVY